jgi:hypothetical protein
MDTPKMRSFSSPGAARAAVQLHISLEDRVCWTDADDEVAIFNSPVDFNSSTPRTDSSRIDGNRFTCAAASEKIEASVFFRMDNGHQMSFYRENGA